VGRISGERLLGTTHSPRTKICELEMFLCLGVFRPIWAFLMCSPGHCVILRTDESETFWPSIK